MNKKKSLSRYIAALLLLCLTISTSLLAGCKEKPNTENDPDGLQKFSDTSFDTFDTLTLITGYDTDEESFQEKTDKLLTALREYHKLYDIYNNYDGISNMKTINDNAGIAPVKVDDKILDMLEYAVEMYQLTNGKTNIAMGSVLKIWHDHRSAAENDPEAATLPDMAELKAAATHTDINDMVIDREAGTVYLTDPDMSLDVGAVAKGYATDRLADIIIEEGWNNFALSVGGNVRTVGPKGDGESWRVGIQTPDSSWGDAYFCLLRLDDLSLVTSGSYQRYFTVEGRQYHHIIDPATLFPKDTFLSVSIICENSAMGDALSTALFNMSREEGQNLIESLPDVEAVWVDPDGNYTYTSGLANILLTNADN